MLYLSIRRAGFTDLPQKKLTTRRAQRGASVTRPRVFFLHPTRAPSFAESVCAAVHARARAWWHTRCGNNTVSPPRTAHAYISPTPLHCPLAASDMAGVDARIPQISDHGQSVDVPDGVPDEFTLAVGCRSR